MKSISSRQNPLVRTFRALADDPDPTGERLLLDGAHLVRDAHEAEALFEVLVVAASRLRTDSEEAQIAAALEARGVEVITADQKAFAALSPVKSPSGIAAIVRRKVTAPSLMCEHPRAFVVAAVDVQDPGNVGALIRAAEAGGATGTFVCGTSASPFSWKALRGSMGSALRLPVATVRTPELALERVRAAGLQSVAAAPRVGLPPDEVDWRPATAMFVGGEGTGLSASLIERCDGRVTIPMRPPVESLNAAVAAALLVYEARRQRM